MRAINCSSEESYTTGHHASCPSQVTHAKSRLKALVPYFLCLKTQRQDSGAFYNQGMWSKPLVRVPFTVFYFRYSHGLVRHILQVLITMTSVTPFLFCFNRAAMSRAELDLTRSL